MIDLSLGALDPLVLAIALAAFFIGGILKGAMGFGLPMLAIPAITAAHSLPMALSITVIPVIFTNLWQLWAFRAHRHTTFLPVFLTLGAVGLVTGGVVLSLVRDAYLEIALGGLVLIYLATRGRKTAAPPPPGRTRLAPVFGFLAGAVHGATGLSGLVGTPYFHSLGLARPAFVFCNGAMFTLFGALHAPTLAALGLYEVSAIWVGLLTLPAAFAGTWIGTRIGTRLKSEVFSRAVVVIVSCAALIPMWNGIRDLFF